MSSKVWDRALGPAGVKVSLASGGETTIYSYSERWTEEDLMVRVVRRIQGPTAGASCVAEGLGTHRPTLKFGKGQRISCNSVPLVGFRMVAIGEVA